RSRSTIRSISWKYSRRIGVPECAPSSRALGGHQFVDAGAQVLKHEILVGGCFAVIDLLGPLLERQLDAESLVDGEGDIEKVQAVDAKIVNGVAFRLDGIAWYIAGLRDDIGDGVERRGHR